MKHKPRTIIVDWLNTIWKTDLPPHAKYLACYLRKYMNSQQDIAWPSYQAIINDTALSRATVAKYLEYLEGEGWIKRDRGRGVSTTYIATFPKQVQEATNKASLMLETSSPPELVQEANGLAGEPTSLAGELKVVRQLNTSKQGSKQISKQECSPCQKFKMNLDWIPEPQSWEGNCYRSGCQPDYKDHIHEFRLYWQNRDDRYNEHGWQGKLINTLKSKYQRTRVEKSLSPEMSPIPEELYKI